MGILSLPLIAEALEETNTMEFSSTQPIQAFGTHFPHSSTKFMKILAAA